MDDTLAKRINYFLSWPNSSIPPGHWGVDGCLELINWCETILGTEYMSSPTGVWTTTNNRFYFKNNSDLLLFKLRF